MLAARIASTVNTFLALFYVLIYITALITSVAAGLGDPVETSNKFGLQGFEAQLPLVSLLIFALIICVLVDGLKLGAISACLPETLILFGIMSLKDLSLRLSERLHGLANPRRIDSLALADPAAPFIASRTSLPPSLATGWSPSIHPSLTYS